MILANFTFRRHPDTMRRQAIAALAGLGLGVMTYLTWIHFNTGGSSFCDFSNRLSCDVVNQSAYASFFGIPVAVCGWLFFAGTIAALYAPRDWGTYRLVMLLMLFGIPFSLVLTIVELTQINSICVFCEFSKLIMLAILVVATLGHRDTERRLTASIATAVVGASLIMAALAIWQANW